MSMKSAKLNYCINSFVNVEKKIQNSSIELLPNYSGFCGECVKKMREDYEAA